jgi:type VI secretion system protein ImpK
MSSDESDKTVFRQPSVDGDRTVIRPMPGGRGAKPPPEQQTPDKSPPVNPRPSAAERPQAFEADTPRYQSQPVAPHASDYFSTSSGLNPLVNAASTLIAVYEKTRHAINHPDVGGLHQRLVSEIKAFENKAREANIKPEVILSARYALCTALDEAVLSTPWGSESAWPQRTLLSLFHNENLGGEKFFLVLDRMREYPTENLYSLELMYILLSLGFEGKYRLIHRGRDYLEQLRDDLFATIRGQRGEYERSLSPHWQGLGGTRKSLTQYVPMWVVASVIGALLVVGYSGFRVWLYSSSSPIVEQLDVIADMRTIERQSIDD